MLDSALYGMCPLDGDVGLAPPPGDPASIMTIAVIPVLVVVALATAGSVLTRITPRVLFAWAAPRARAVADFIKTCACFSAVMAAERNMHDATPPTDNADIVAIVAVNAIIAAFARRIWDSVFDVQTNHVAAVAESKEVASEEAEHMADRCVRNTLWLHLAHPLIFRAVLAAPVVLVGFAMTYTTFDSQFVHVARRGNNVPVFQPINAGMAARIEPLDPAYTVVMLAYIAAIYVCKPPPHAFAGLVLAAAIIAIAAAQVLGSQATGLAALLRVTGGTLAALVVTPVFRAVAYAFSTVYNALTYGMIIAADRSTYTVSAATGVDDAVTSALARLWCSVIEFRGSALSVAIAYFGFFNRAAHDTTHILCALALVYPFCCLLTSIFNMALLGEDDFKNKRFYAVTWAQLIAAYCIAVLFHLGVVANTFVKNAVDASEKISVTTSETHQAIADTAILHRVPYVRRVVSVSVLVLRFLARLARFRTSATTGEEGPTDDENPTRAAPPPPKFKDFFFSNTSPDLEIMWKLFMRYTLNGLEPPEDVWNETWDRLQAAQRRHEMERQQQHTSILIKSRQTNRTASWCAGEDKLYRAHYDEAFTTFFGTPAWSVRVAFYAVFIASAVSATILFGDAVIPHFWFIALCAVVAGCGTDARKFSVIVIIMLFMIVSIQQNPLIARTNMASPAHGRRAFINMADSEHASSPKTFTTYGPNSWTQESVDPLDPNPHTKENLGDRINKGFQTIVEDVVSYPFKKMTYLARFNGGIGDLTRNNGISTPAPIRILIDMGILSEERWSVDIEGAGN